MLKVEVTHLKAPWPAGATVGAVVLLAVAILPAWAVGKCIALPADDEREPVAVWEPPVMAEPELVVNPASAAQQLTERADRIAELGQQLQDAQQALGTARAEIQSLGAQLVEAQAETERLRGALSTAEASTSRTEADLLDVIEQRDAALADAKALREAVPATVGTITGDGAGEALPPVEEAKAAPAKASKKGGAA